MSSAPSVINVHTPFSSFSIIHPLTHHTLSSLYDKLSHKPNTPYYGRRVGPSWLKYEWNETLWNLDDDADYTIFVWRQQQTPSEPPSLPTLHLKDPSEALPAPPDYRNPSFYIFQPSHAHVRETPSTSSSPRPRSSKSPKNKKRRGGSVKGTESDDDLPAFKKEFERFHSENGVRTVMGSIGPVNQVRMLLKSGYRHVYISRKFALKHGFIPADAAPGHHGYSGLVNIGTLPIALTPSTNTIPANPSPSPSQDGPRSRTPGKPKSTLMQVYLSEEQHFDVVLGRSFFERRQIRTSAIDPTDVVCLDTGEKVECELVILKDGRGKIVTVT